MPTRKTSSAKGHRVKKDSAKKGTSRKTSAARASVSSKAANSEKRVQDTLRESEERFAQVAEQSREMIWEVDTEGLYTYVSRACTTLFGYREDEVVGKLHFYDIHPEEGREEFRRRAFEAFEKKLPFRDLPNPIMAKDGRVLDVLTNGVPVLDADGSLRGYRGSDRDITEHKRVEDALRQSEQRFRTVFETIPGAVFVHRGEQYLDVNGTMTQIVGYTRDELLAMPFWKLLHPDSLDLVKARGLARCRGEEPPSLYEARIITKDGHERWVVIAATRVSYEGEPSVLGTLVDVTPLKEAQAAAERQRQLLTTLIDAMPDLIYVKDTESRYLLNNRAQLRLLGVSSPEEAIGKTDADFFPAELATRYLADEQGVIASGRPLANREERTQDQDGNEQWLLTTKVPFHDGQGRVLGIVGIGRDITERKRAEEALRESESELRQVIDLIPHSIYAKDADSRFIFVNRRSAELMGSTPEEAVGKTQHELTPQPEEADSLVAEDRTVIKHQAPILGKEHVFTDAQGVQHIEEVTKIPFTTRRTHGTAVLGISIDVTESRRAEQERRELERRVQHAQKLESLGIMAGGIAHDFNNILMAIMGNTEIALRELSDLSPVRPFMEDVAKATHRAVELTRQMLAYSGHGQLVVRALNLSELVAEMTHLLKASIPKNVVMTVQLPDGLPSIKADTAQIQQVVMNLITNAGEAIGEDRAGTITVTTGVMDCDAQYLARSCLLEIPEPGEFVYVEAKDTGCGMDAETQERLFDPFFTTKFMGRGLGMSAVQGIVRGHEGALLVDSEVGRGTTIRALFPSLGEQVTAAADTTAGETDDGWRGQGLVLAVDDDDSVRSLAARMLERLGFDVVTARDGTEAVEVLREHRDAVVGVLLDFSMPHMDGAKVFQELREVREDVPVILASGYATEELEKEFGPQGIAGFLDKPYKMHSLRAKVREAFGQ